MIRYLSIKNFAIIKDLSLDFGEGLNIITGETGAGKSIIIEAVSMALGARADSTYVRTGADRALIQLVLDEVSPGGDTAGSGSGRTAGAAGDAADKEVILTREILAGGRSTCRIGDEVVTLARLNEFCRKAVDLHGQYDNQALLNPENHINVLDSFDENGEISGAYSKYISDFEEFSALRAELGNLRKSIAENLRKKDFMEFEAGEIAKVNPQPGEDEELAASLSVFQNREKIFSAASKAQACLYSGEGSCTELLTAAASEVEKISELSPALGEILNVIRDSCCAIEDAARELSPFIEGEPLSEAEIDSVISRLEAIEALKRKYGGSLDEVLAYREKLETDLANMENFDYLEEELRKKVAAKYAEAEKSAIGLSEVRKAAGAKLEKEVNRELAELNFKSAQFSVRFEEVPRKNNHYALGETGLDIIEFFISTNKGEALKPMAKIASGGEISRIMLAFKKILGDYSNVPTFIFDEIDTGISGRAAAVVAVKLAEIARKHQVICITHLPQIAVMGDAHYLIEKVSDDRETYTQVSLMDEERFVTEVARLSGNVELTDVALANARELIENAKSKVQNAD